MTQRDLARLTVATMSLVLLMAGCGKAPPVPPPPKPPEAPGLPPPPKPQPITLTLRAAADVNPDSTNRPSPVVIRIYLLKTDAAFKSADFFALYDDEKAALKDELLARSNEFTIRPGESIPVPEFLPSPEARSLGVLAAYRDYRNAQWRMVAPLPIVGPTTIAVGRARVELAGR